MKPQCSLNLRAAEADTPPPLSAANFCRTSLGRVLLHMECICYHPASARFYLRGLTRNLRECAITAKSSTLRFLKTN